MKWQKEKPDYACTFLTREGGHYTIWHFAWEVGEPPEDVEYEEYTKYYYLAWLDQDGCEWDDIADCNFDEYLVLQRLKTLEEIE